MPTYILIKIIFKKT